MNVRYTKETPPEKIVEVMVWKREVELRGLPLELQLEFEKRGAFWATRGLRMTDRLFAQLEAEHPEFFFNKLELKSPEPHTHQ